MPGKRSSGKLDKRRERAQERGFLRSVKLKIPATQSGAVGCNDGVNKLDPWQLPENDPWSCARIPSGVPHSSLYVVNKLPSEFFPAVSPPCELPFAPSRVDSVDAPPNVPSDCFCHDDSQLSSALGLIARQNDTIAMLTSQVDRMYFLWPCLSSTTSGDSGCAELWTRLAKMEQDVESLTKSMCRAIQESTSKLERMEQDIKSLSKTMGPAIQETIDKRMEVLDSERLKTMQVVTTEVVPDAPTSIGLELEVQFYKLLRPHIDGLVIPLIRQVALEVSIDHKDSLSKMIVARMTSLMKDYDKMIQRQLLEFMENMCHDQQKTSGCATTSGEKLACNHADQPLHSEPDAKRQFDLSVRDETHSTDCVGCVVTSSGVGCMAENRAAADGGVRSAQITAFSPPRVVPSHMVQSPRVSCIEFLEMSRVAKSNVPIIPARKERLLMLCDGRISSDTASVVSGLSSNCERKLRHENDEIDSELSSDNEAKNSERDLHCVKFMQW